MDSFFPMLVTLSPTSKITRIIYTKAAAPQRKSIVV